DLQNVASPATISLAGGFPSPTGFPFKDAILNLTSGGKLVLDEELLNHAQQYGPTTGHPPLLERTKGIVRRYHNPPNWDNSQVSITAGSQDGFSRSLEMLLEPGDYVIVEQPSFCGALSVMNPYKLKYLEVETDDLGMKPESLEKVLSMWSPDEVREAREGVPKVIYTNPSGSNPIGASLSTKRKESIYEIARRYNLLILEDDPYYFIQFGDPKNIPKSFLSLDTDGRVMRFDSFSKIVCPGFRIGYVTGPKRLVNKIVQHSQVTILHTSSFSQVICNELLKQWGDDGLERNMLKIRDFYSTQKNHLNKAAEKYLSGLCEWNTPVGGMFLWVKVLGLTDTTEMVIKRALKKEILLMPGNTFMVNHTKPCNYLRLSFSYCTPSEMEQVGWVISVFEYLKRRKLLHKEKIQQSIRHLRYQLLNK
ncbi:UNVERIFIED_CONTAM: hypothetical protein GTU68_001550, partial [Idotea baltica]|nr:hypothetical protein [Idotea baltica]